MSSASGTQEEMPRGSRASPAQRAAAARHTDTAPFQQACQPLHEQMLDSYPALAPVYGAIQDYNAQYPAGAS